MTTEISWLCISNGGVYCPYTLLQWHLINLKTAVMFCSVLFSYTLINMWPDGPVTFCCLTGYKMLSHLHLSFPPQDCLSVCPTEKCHLCPMGSLPVLWPTQSNPAVPQETHEFCILCALILKNETSGIQTWLWLVLWCLIALFHRNFSCN